MTYAHLAIMAGFAFAYSITAGRLQRLPISGPILFTAFGLALGPMGLGWLTFDMDAEGLKSLAEWTLALVLFTDAAGTDLAVLRRSEQIPLRLLLLGLPLTILLGWAMGSYVLPGLTLLEVALLATMLAPTDAALGSAVVTNPKVPASMREGLNVESGLNDGICVPILLVFLAFATGTAGQDTGFGLAARLVAEELGIGLAVGLTTTLVGAWVIRLTARRGWLASAWRQITISALAFSCFALAQTLGGSGFIACFSGGLLFGALAKKQKQELLETTEGLGNALALATWVVFGSFVVGQMLGHLTWQMVAYAALSLTVVRMLPVFLCLLGSGVDRSGKLFVGWFGPRGLASIVFIVIVLQARLLGNDTLVLVVGATVLLSILAHGFSANPLVARLGTGDHTRTGSGPR